MDKRPNIVMIVVDQMRGDCLGIAGHPDVKTPYLDSLAAGGVRFSRAYSACPSCVPARAAMYTGMSQERNGRVGYEDGVNWRYEHTIAGELQKAGYYTQCVGKRHVHPVRTTLGFDDCRIHEGYMHYYRRPETPSYENQRVADDYFYWLKKELGADADVTDTGVDCNSWMTRPWIYEEKYHPSNWVADECLDFLRRRDREKPFFLMASFVRPHPPLDSPQYYLDMYNNKDLTPPVRGDWDDEARMMAQGHGFACQTSPIDQQYVHEFQAGYYAAITHLDHQIGRILIGLQAELLLDNTVFLFVSDHGEMLGDHLWSRKSLPYEGSTHIPLFLSGPSRLIGKNGTVRDDLVELRDVMPTLLEIAGVPIPDTVDGVSVLHPVDREMIHGEHPMGDMSNQYVVSKTGKYVWFSQTGREQFFDLAHDPKETHNAIADPQYQEEIARMKKYLIGILDGREEGYSDGRQLFVGKTPLSTLSFAR